MGPPAKLSYRSAFHKKVVFGAGYTVAGTPLKSRGKNNVPVSIVYLPTLFKLNNSRGKTNSPGSRGFQLLAF